MAEPATFEIDSEQTASAALAYFNGFHDGFIKMIVIESQDRMHEDRSQSCTGIFEVTVHLAHYNYRSGDEPFHRHNQMVRAEFRNVQRILLDFGEGFLGNTIMNLSVIAGSRRKVGQTSTEPCLELHLTRHFYLEQERRYEFRDLPLFTFTNATFSEEASAN